MPKLFGQGESPLMPLDHEAFKGDHSKRLLQVNAARIRVPVLEKVHEGDVLLLERRPQQHVTTAKSDVCGTPSPKQSNNM